MPGIFDKLHGIVHGLGSEVVQRIQDLGEVHTHTHGSAACSDGLHNPSEHRYGSFAPQRNGNDVKWYVDGCAYMWAVSRALEQARESIWILDCGSWTSCEDVNLLTMGRVALSRAVSSQTSFQE